MARRLSVKLFEIEDLSKDDNEQLLKRIKELEALVDERPCGWDVDTWLSYEDDHEWRYTESQGTYDENGNLDDGPH